VAQRAEVNVRCHTSVESATKRCVNHLSLLNPQAIPQVSNYADDECAADEKAYNADVSRAFARSGQTPQPPFEYYP
jgi:hypothetical protein